VVVDDVLWILEHLSLLVLCRGPSPDSPGFSSGKRTERVMRACRERGSADEGSGRVEETS
jgi:hypothetical protein